MSNVAEKIREIIAEQLGVDLDDVTLEQSVSRDLDADSLDAAEIIMAIEDEYNIEIEQEEAEEFKTVQDLVSYVENAIA